MKTCDRCSVPGCLLNYLGKTCQQARQELCPEIQPNRAELIASMDMIQMTYLLTGVFQELCEDGIPSPEFMSMWLAGTPSKDEPLGVLLP